MVPTPGFSILVLSGKPGSRFFLNDIYADFDKFRPTLMGCRNRNFEPIFKLNRVLETSPGSNITRELKLENDNGTFG